MIPIHTLSIMRNEFRAYKSLIKERDKLIEEYETPLKSLKNELLEVEGKLSQIKSPGKSDGLGGFIQDSVDKYNHLIAKKDELKMQLITTSKNMAMILLKKNLNFGMCVLKLLSIILIIWMRLIENSLKIFITIFQSINAWNVTTLLTSKAYIEKLTIF